MKVKRRRRRKGRRENAFPLTVLKVEMEGGQKSTARILRYQLYQTANKNLIFKFNIQILE